MIIDKQLETAKGSPGYLVQLLSEAFEKDRGFASDILREFSHAVPKNAKETEIIAKSLAIRFQADPEHFSLAEASRYAAGRVEWVRKEFPMVFAEKEEKVEVVKESKPVEPKAPKAPKGPGKIEQAAELIRGVSDKAVAVAKIMEALGVDKQRATAYYSNAVKRLEGEAK